MCPFLARNDYYRPGGRVPGAARLAQKQPGSKGSSIFIWNVSTAPALSPGAAHRSKGQCIVHAIDEIGLVTIDRLERDRDSPGGGIVRHLTNDLNGARVLGAAGFPGRIKTPANAADDDQRTGAGGEIDVGLEAFGTARPHAGIWRGNAQAVI